MVKYSTTRVKRNSITEGQFDRHCIVAISFMVGHAWWVKKNEKKSVDKDTCRKSIRALLKEASAFVHNNEIGI